MLNRELRYWRMCLGCVTMTQKYFTYHWKYLQSTSRRLMLLKEDERKLSKCVGRIYWQKKE